MGVSTDGVLSPSHQARRTRFLRCMGSDEEIVNQMCVTTPAPVISSSVADWPGSTGVASRLPPVRSQLELRRVLEVRRRACAKSSSGVSGCPVGAGAAAGELAAAPAAFKPRSAAAETMPPSSLRLTGKPSLESDECIERALLAFKW